MAAFMQIWPAIDIRAGKCVRLQRGDYDRETVFGDDPVAMASRWVSEGATSLHLVDLDGARDGKLVNGQVIAASSNHGPQLGQILFEKGLISLKKLQKVLNEAQSTGRHLGETLLDRGLIKQGPLKSVIRLQINQTIQDLVQWQEGLFQYRDGPIEFDERGIEDISIMGMMLDALRLSDELTDTQAPEKSPDQGMTIA